MGVQLWAFSLGKLIFGVHSWTFKELQTFAEIPLGLPFLPFLGHPPFGRDTILAILVAGPLIEGHLWP